MLNIWYNHAELHVYLISINTQMIIWCFYWSNFYKFHIFKYCQWKEISLCMHTWCFIIISLFYWMTVWLHELFAKLVTYFFFYILIENLQILVLSWRHRRLFINTCIYILKSMHCEFFTLKSIQHVLKSIKYVKWQKYVFSNI